MSLTRKVAFNTGVQVGGRVITTLTSLFLVGGLARYLDVDGFGRFTTIFAFTAFFAVIADFGFFNVLVREISAGREDIKKIVSNIITFRTIFAFLVYLIGFVVALFLNYEHEVKIGIGLISLAQFWLTLNLTLVGVFQAKFRMDKAVITDILGRLVTLSVVYYLIHNSASLLSLLSAYIVGNFINFLLSLILVSPYVKVKWSIDAKYWREIAHIAIPMGLLTVISYIYFHIDMIILSLLKSDYDVGIYGASYKILEILLTFPGIFIGAVFPIMARYFSEGNSKLANVSQQSLNFLMVTGVPIAAGVFYLAKPIINLIAGGKFVTASASGLSLFSYPATSVLVLQILIFALFLSFFSHLFNSLVIAANKQSKLVLPNILALLLNITLNLILIPIYSYLGAALITVLGELIVLIFSVYITVQSGIKLPSISLLPKILLSGAAMIGFLAFFPSSSLAVQVILGSIIYFLVLFIIGGIPRDVFQEIFFYKRSEG